MREPYRHDDSSAVRETPGGHRLLDQETARDGRENRAGRVHHQMAGQAMHRNELAQALRPELVVQQTARRTRLRRPRTLRSRDRGSGSAET